MKGHYDMKPVNGKTLPQKLMEDSELYIQLVFDVYQSEEKSSQSETKSEQLQNFIDRAFLVYHRKEDVCVFVFMHVLSYYNMSNM